jgi:hypothetical protein
MRKLILFLLLTLNGFSQNLVQNSSFEDYDICPNETTLLAGIIPSPWLSPTNSSVDYYNACSNYLGVPYHGVDGFQYAKTGNGYVAFWLYNGGINYREYLQSKLLDTLEADKCYYVEFNINLRSGLKYAVKNADLHFSNNQINTTSTGYVLDLEPHVSWFRDDYITDTMNWTKISGIYTAAGGEEYITIGNFFNDAETDTLYTGFGDYHGAYYYIDDITVIPIGSLPNGMPAFAGEDVLVNPGDSIFIGQEISNLNCTWRTLDGTVIRTNTSGLYVKPTQTTSYVVEQNLCGVISYDTVVVTLGYVSVSSLEGGLRRVTISPNPNNGSFTIQNTSIVIQELVLLDELGRSIQILDPKSKTFNLDLPKGVYFFESKSEDHRILEKMVVN